jgi:hypothetical protein
LREGLILFNPDPVIGCYDRSNPLWLNPSHLSPEGDCALGSAIGTAIALDLEQRPWIRTAGSYR